MRHTHVAREAQRFLDEKGLGGWLVWDFRGANPVLAELTAPSGPVTRPVFLWIPPGGADPVLVAHHVDRGRFEAQEMRVEVYRSREELLSILDGLLPKGKPVAMEYTPLGAIPRASRVDAGTLELVRSFGVEVVPSADLLQYATQRWTPEQVESHRKAVRALGEIVMEAFRYIGRNHQHFVTEPMIAEYIRHLYEDNHLVAPDGPIVAVNRNSADPHYEPATAIGTPVRQKDWVLIDLWAKADAPENAVYADITWVAYVGDKVPSRNQEVFDAVVGARDAAVDLLQAAHRDGRALQGWEVDRAARQFIEERGFGKRFTHRLGHSLGREVHGEAVNLDGFETQDTRQVIQGVGLTVEPGIYLPEEFGVRSEIDVFMADSGPEVTSAVQREIVQIP